MGRETKVINMRLNKEEVEELEKIAISLNYFYGGKPSLSKVLRQVAKGNLIISKKI